MTAAFNRRMRKTARTVVWEGAGAKSPALDPIDRNPFDSPLSPPTYENSTIDFRSDPMPSAIDWLLLIRLIKTLQANAAANSIAQAFQNFNYPPPFRGISN